jgi:ubiquinol-cytochrome c reductase cytochrome b subunit
MVPGTAMPAISLADAQLNALAAFLLKLTPENAAALSSAPAFAVGGALVYQANYCGSCHMVNGIGMRIGPALNGVGQRRTREWIVKHFEDPASVSPGTLMPAYRFTPREMDRIVNYLLALP